MFPISGSNFTTSTLPGGKTRWNDARAGANRKRNFRFQRVSDHGNPRFLHFNGVITHILGV